MGAAAEADPTVLYVSGWCRSGSTVLGNVLAEVTPADQTPAEHAAEVVAWQAGCRTRHTWRVLHGRPAGGGWPAVLAATYRAVAEVTGAEVLVDTSKYASDAAWLWRLDGIRPAQPHLVRDPRAAACAHPGGSLRVRHEDLTADPRAVVGRVLALPGRPASRPGGGPWSPRSRSRCCTTTATSDTPKETDMDLGLAGKVALVGGGSSGIGLAVARELLAEGATVSICGRDPTRLEAARAELEGLAGPPGPPRVLATALDLRDGDAARDWVEATAAACGAVHVVVSNAGGPPAGASGAFDLDAYRQALELCLLAHVGLVRAALPHLKRAGWGRVLLVTSETIREPNPKFALSNVARPGLVGYAKTLVRELGPGEVTVNVLAPGYTATAPVLDTLEGDVEAGLARVAADAGIPLGRVARPEEVAAVAVFLASERASFVTGTVQLVDGGAARGV